MSTILPVPPDLAGCEGRARAIAGIILCPERQCCKGIDRRGLRASSRLVFTSRCDVSSVLLFTATLRTSESLKRPGKRWQSGGCRRTKRHLAKHAMSQAYPSISSPEGTQESFRRQHNSFVLFNLWSVKSRLPTDVCRRTAC